MTNADLVANSGKLKNIEWVRKGKSVITKHSEHQHEMPVFQETIYTKQKSNSSIKINLLSFKYKIN